MLKITATGRLGKDAILKEVSGTKVINFSIAHSEKYNGEEKTTWLECAKWGEKTGVAPYLVKGANVLIEGTPEIRTYPKNDGTTGVTFMVRVTSLELLGGGNKEQANNHAPNDQPQRQYANSNASMQASRANPVAVPDMDEDLPF